MQYISYEEKGGWFSHRLYLFQASETIKTAQDIKRYLETSASSNRQLAKGSSIKVYESWLNKIGIGWCLKKLGYAKEVALVSSDQIKWVLTNWESQKKEIARLKKIEENRSNDTFIDKMYDVYANHKDGKPYNPRDLKDIESELSQQVEKAQSALKDPSKISYPLSESPFILSNIIASVLDKLRKSSARKEIPGKLQEPEQRIPEPPIAQAPVREAQTKLSNGTVQPPDVLENQGVVNNMEPLAPIPPVQQRVPPPVQQQVPPPERIVNQPVQNLFDLGGFGFVFGGADETYHRQTIPSLNVSGNLNLNGTTVTENAVAGGNITATNANARELKAGGNITLVSSHSQVRVVAGGNLTAMNSTLQKVKAGGIVTLNNCPQLGEVNAGGSVNIDTCPKIDSVFSGGSSTLRESTVLGNVTCGITPEVINTKILGKLRCNSNKLLIEGSEIDTIDMRCNRVINNGGGIVISSNGTNVISIGAGSNLDNVIINGVPASQLVNNNEQNNDQPQVLELKNCIVKHVIFEGGKGEVLLSGNSEVRGTVTGGIIRRVR